MSSSAPRYDDLEHSQAPPAYAVDIVKVYQQWQETTRATRELAAYAPQFAKAQKDLENENTKLKALKEKSASAFSLIHPKNKSLLPGLFGVGKSKSKEHLPSGADGQSEAQLQADFEQAHSEENRQATVVEQLFDNVAQMRKKKEALTAIASSTDGAWERLSRAAEITTINDDSTAAKVGAAFEELGAAENSYGVAKQIQADLSRARLTGQHAHKYLSDAMRVTDDLNPGSTGSRLAEGFGGDLVSMSKQNEYRAAVTAAHKGQVCLDECFRVLQPHEHIIPANVLEDLNALKTSGIQQVARIYDLLYSGQKADVNAHNSVKTMIERQEAAFKHLTAVVVWVQDRVPACEADEMSALTRRDAEREKVAELWMSNRRM